MNVNTSLENTWPPPTPIVRNTREQIESLVVDAADSFLHEWPYFWQVNVLEDNEPYEAAIAELDNQSDGRPEQMDIQNFALVVAIASVKALKPNIEKTSTVRPRLLKPWRSETAADYCANWAATYARNLKTAVEFGLNHEAGLTLLKKDTRATE